MEYIKAKAAVEEYEAEDVIVTSEVIPDQNMEDCAQPSWDAEYCDGVTQAVTKPFGY